MIEITLSTFTPAQAEKITGVSVDQQRNLRRHGYLAATEGHARFDAFGLARLLAIHELSKKDIGPSQMAGPNECFDVASICARGIVWSLLGWIDAYEGDHLCFETGRPPREPLAPEDKQLLREEAKRHGYDPSCLNFDSDWHERSEILRKKIFSMLNLGRAIPAKFCVWWANDKCTWESDLNQAFSGSQTERRSQGATVILDQEALASLMLRRVDVAFAHVEETTAEGDAN